MSLRRRHRQCFSKIQLSSAMERQCLQLYAKNFESAMAKISGIFGLHRI